MREHKTISIADQIFEQLERDILTGKYQRGEVLSEMRLSAELGVSRTPIREALRRLEQENILSDSGRHRRGGPRLNQRAYAVYVPTAPPP